MHFENAVYQHFWRIIMIESAGKDGLCVVTCDGGCGRSVTLRRKKVQKADYYLCNSKADGQSCKANLPPLPEGMICSIIFNAAASFTGYAYKVPNTEEQRSIKRANEILQAAMSQEQQSASHRPKKRKIKRNKRSNFDRSFAHDEIVTEDMIHAADTERTNSRAPFQSTDLESKIKEIGGRLRKIQYKLGVVPKHILKIIPDIDLIESYLACPECGWEALTRRQLLSVIEHASSMDDFWLKCGCFGGVDYKQFICGGVHAFD